MSTEEFLKKTYVTEEDIFLLTPDQMEEIANEPYRKWLALQK